MFWLSGYVGNGKERNGPFNSYIYGNKVYVGGDIIPKIAVDKAARGVFVANNLFYFENDPVMVLGDQYKPDVGGGSQIKNVFFENNIFKKNHWPNEVLIQPKNNIYLPYPINVDDIIYDLNNFFLDETAIKYLKNDSKGLWKGF